LIFVQGSNTWHDAFLRYWAAASQLCNYAGKQLVLHSVLRCSAMIIGKLGA
jgi:hypothetical protein